MKNITFLALLFVCLFVQTTFADIEEENKFVVRQLPVSDKIAHGLYKKVRKPNTLQRLYNNMLMAEKNRLYLREDFYNEKNLINFLGCKKIFWASNVRGVKRATLVYSSNDNAYIGHQPIFEATYSQSHRRKISTLVSGDSYDIDNKLTYSESIDDEYIHNKNINVKNIKFVYSSLLLWADNNDYKEQAEKFKRGLLELDESVVFENRDLSFLKNGHLLYVDERVNQPIKTSFPQDSTLKDPNYLTQIRAVAHTPSTPLDMLSNIKLAMDYYLPLRKDFYNSEYLSYFFGNNVPDWEMTFNNNIIGAYASIFDVINEDNKIRGLWIENNDKTGELTIKFWRKIFSFEDVEKIFGTAWIYPNIYDDGLRFFIPEPFYEKSANKPLKINPNTFLTNQGIRYYFEDATVKGKLSFTFDRESMLESATFYEELK